MTMGAARAALLAGLLAALLTVTARAATWPAGQWHTSSPEAQGVDSAAVARLIEDIVRPGRRIDALLLVRNGHLIAELVVAPYNADTAHDLRSLTKSVVSTLVGVALQRGDLRSAQQPLAELLALPPAADARQRAITVEHLLDMRSGIAWREWPYDADSDLLQMAASRDWLAYILARTMREAPGERFWYSGAAPHLLSAVLTRATGQPLAAYAREHLFEPIGIAPSPWLADPQGLSIGDSALSLRPHDLARLGWLLISDGVWRGRRLLPADWLNDLLAAPQPHGLRDTAALPPRFKRMWWVDPALPMLQASGRHGQHLVLLPRQQTLLVVLARATHKDEAVIDMPKIVAEHLLPALRSPSPLPPNRAAEASLKQVIASRAATPPLAGLRPAAAALALSGQRFRLEPNRQGLSALALHLEASGQGRLSMTWGQRPGGTLERPFGAAGRFALSAPTPWGVFATRAAWRNPSTVEIESERLQGSTVTQYKLVFERGGVELQILDPDSPAATNRGTPVAP